MSFNFNDFIQPETYGVTIVNTESIVGSEITKYYGTVTSNVVLGISVFSELFSSFTDIVGGNSATYEMKMRQDVPSEAVTMLSGCYYFLWFNTVKKREGDAFSLLFWTSD